MTYRPPVKDLALMLSVVGHDTLARRAFPELDRATVLAILETAGGFAADVLAPLNTVGDRQGARIEDGDVRAAPGFAEAYGQFAEQGWNSLSAHPESGGQGLSKALEIAVFEMVHSANMAFALCPMLTQGAIEALTLHGTETQKRVVLPRLVSGQWTGAMAMTEAHAGSDLAALTTRAEPDGKGGYRLYGEKIFITWGDHDAAENICHLVLARLPDAPPGVKGISLFLASKYLYDSDGRIGARNGFRAASIEHKLGIHGSPTCVMVFEGAEATLVGDLNRGLAHMFTMMNAARLQVGIQGVAIAERAFQQALGFSRERQQGAALWSGGGAIWGHPDVRRMLMISKAKIEAARGLCLMTAVLADVARNGDAQAGARQNLLTPIAKAWSTDIGVEVASVALQVHGGIGFIEEAGAAQHYRDARIGPIYEGANGIQAIDLIGRKLRGDNGAAMRSLCAEMQETADLLTPAAGRKLAVAVAALKRATDWVLTAGDPDRLSSASAYLRLTGEVVGGWILAKQALAASGTDAWSRSKGALLELYLAHVLVGAGGIATSITSGAADLEDIDPEALSV